MKLMQTKTVHDWRTTFSETVQVAYTPIPTGEVIEVEDDEKPGVMRKQYVTEERLAFGFQTDKGRGKGVQWIPVEDVNEALDRLEYYAKNGVDAIIASDEWLSPAESIDDTIARVKNEDGSYDISFRVRKAKGCKSCRVPESDFADFVTELRNVQSAIPDAITQVEENRALEAAKAAEAAKTPSSDE